MRTANNSPVNRSTHGGDENIKPNPEGLLPQATGQQFRSDVAQRPPAAAFRLGEAPKRLIGPHEVQPTPFAEGSRAHVFRSPESGLYVVKLAKDPAAGREPKAHEAANLRNTNLEMRQEVENILTARRVGVDAPRPLDWGTHVEASGARSLQYIKMTDSGTSLDNLGIVPERVGGSLMKGMVSSLKPAHDAGYAHSDVSLGNFAIKGTLDADGLPSPADARSPRPIDFGLWDEEPEDVDGDVLDIANTALQLMNPDFREADGPRFDMRSAAEGIRDPALRDVFEGIFGAAYRGGNRVNLIRDLHVWDQSQR